MEQLLLLQRSKYSEYFSQTILTRAWKDEGRFLWAYTIETQESEQSKQSSVALCKRVKDQNKMDLGLS